MILLDTNVISEFMLPEPDARVVEWFDLQPRSSIGTTVITLYEIRSGLLAMPEGRRRAALTGNFARIVQLAIEGRILPFDREAAERTAELAVAGRKKGRPGDLRDTMIAGIVLATGATLATRNTKHFEEIAARVINPWDGKK